MLPTFKYDPSKRFRGLVHDMVYHAIMDLHRERQRRPAGYGSGTKLPHNITALLGVMDGAASDLRTGLPWQMVEIHEPVRLLFVIETRPDILLRIVDRDPVLARLVHNEWVRIAVLDPDSTARTSAPSIFIRNTFGFCRSMSTDPM